MSRHSQLLLVAFVGGFDGSSHNLLRDGFFVLAHDLDLSSRYL